MSGLYLDILINIDTDCQLQKNLLQTEGFQFSNCWLKFSVLKQPSSYCNKFKYFNWYITQLDFNTKWPLLADICYLSKMFKNYVKLQL